MRSLAVPRGSSVLERIAARSHEEGDCIIWEGSSGRYGAIKVNGMNRPVHRVVWEEVVGPIEEGLELDHLCRNRLCMNPDHLEPVDHRTNVLRGVGPTARNAVATHCLQGHPLSEENVYRTAPGYRSCRVCQNAAARRYRQRKANPS